MCGYQISLVICDSRRKIGSWGSNFRGKLGIGSIENKSFPPGYVVGLDAVVVLSLCCGSYQCLALTKSDLVSSKKRNKVLVWGMNAYGQHGSGKMDDDGHCIPSEMDFFARLSVSVRDIACGHYHNAAITEDDALFMWGSNYDGQCAVEAKQNCVVVPTKVLFLMKNGLKGRCKSICCSYGHNLAIIAYEDGEEGDKSIYSWGNEKRGIRTRDNK